MFIVYETIASNDLRNDPKIKIIGSFWSFTIAKVDPADEATTRVDWLKGEILSEQVALANKLASSVNGELTVVNANFTSYEELVFPSSGGDQGYTKQTYFLTDVDKTNAKNFIAAILKNYIKNHLTCDGVVNPSDTGQRLIDEIENTLSLNDMQILAKNYFNVELSAYVVNRPKNPKFAVNW
jgi:hypothetical protein